MLANAKVHPTLPVVDLERAKSFYVGKLGLKVMWEHAMMGAMLEAGEGSVLYIYPRGATKADNTAASFIVKDVESTVMELRAKGIVFDDVELPGIQMVDQIATMELPSGTMKSAWFKDTEGNILAVTQM